MLLPSNQETKYSKKRLSSKNKKRLLLPRLRLEKRECNNSIRLELKRLSQMTGNKARRTRLIPFSQRLKRKWTKKWMMLNT